MKPLQYIQNDSVEDDPSSNYRHEKWLSIPYRKTLNHLLLSKE
jgi:hypothetical protein